MATINQIVFDVRERLNQFSDDSEFSDRLIIHRLNSVRSTLLLQHLNNFRIPTNLSIVQTLCIEMELASTEICGSFDCEEILRSKKPLPEVLYKHTGPAILTIKTPNVLSTNIELIPQDKISILKYKRIPVTVAFLGTDNHLYLYSTKTESYKFIDCISVSAVFYNPLDLQNFSNCCGCENPTSCFNPDVTTYPILPELEETIVSEVIKTFAPKLEIPEDKVNNSDDK